MNYRLEDENGKGSIGYAGSPLLLPLHFGLYRCFGFKRLDLLWTLFSLLGLSVTTVLFAGRLFGRGWILILASVGALWGFAPTALSLQLGQMEGLYVPLVTMALYLLAFHSLRADGKVNRPALCACGLLLAAASAVKIYPAVLGIYLGMSGLAEARFKRKALVQTPAGQAGVWFLGGLIGIAGSAFLAFGPELLGSFAERIRLLDRLDAANLHEYRPSFADYITHAARWLAPGGNFHLRAGGVAGLFQIGLAWAGGLTVCRLARSFPRDSDPRRYLLGFSWTLMALPTLMRHWWSYYGVIQFIPLLITITFCAGVQNPRTRLGIEGLLIAGLFFAHPESVRFLLWMAGVPSRELPFLVATPGPPHLIRPGPAALLFGWPGQLLLLAATWITLLRSRSAS
ncbi:MAG: hypothetical protein HYZ93_07045 [Candidatus Omnitrophica bacterium]|nr:hypothetical protein [Candidatus Omnitrophota bacterium]